MAKRSINTFHKIIVSRRMGHHVHGNSVDHEILKGIAKPLPPVILGKRLITGPLQRSAMMFDVGQNRFPCDLIVQHKNQQLGQIVLRHVEGGELPIIDA